MADNELAPQGGACLGKPTEWWFPLQKSSKREDVVELRKNTQRAKIICIGCEVRQECLDYSLRWEPFGIWGGHDEQERAQMRWNQKVSLHREGRIVFSGVGLRDANGSTVFGDK